ncbi:MAG: hypothetical protein ACO2Z7_07265, partial [Burkholderiaceae bacterium]
MTDAQKTKARDQHAEIIDLARPYTHVVLGMDANETTHTKGRIQLRNDGSTSYSGTDPDGKKGGGTLCAYHKLLHNAHKHKAESEIKKGSHSKEAKCRPPYPAERDMTHFQPSRDKMTLMAQIDLVMVSKSLLSRIDTCEIDSRTQHWTTKNLPRKSFHSALVVSLAWEDMWQHESQIDNLERKNQPTMGATLKRYPNYAALTPAKAAIISKSVNAEINERWQRLRGLMRPGAKKKRTSTQRLAELTNILNNIAGKTASRVLGLARPIRRPENGPLAGLEEAWDHLAQLVGAALGTTIDVHMNSAARPALDGPAICKAKADLMEHGIKFPTRRKEWLTWWHSRDYHKALALTPGEDLTLTDSLAANNPKRFYTQATKPIASSNIHALRHHKTGTIITSDAGIENEQHDYLQRIAEPGEPDLPAPREPGAQPAQKRSRPEIEEPSSGQPCREKCDCEKHQEQSSGNSSRHNAKLPPPNAPAAAATMTGLQPSKKQRRHSNHPQASHAEQAQPNSQSIMHRIHTDELLLQVNTIATSSSPGYNGISPGLLKIITTTTWSEEIPQTYDDELADKLHQQYYEYMEAHEVDKDPSTIADKYKNSKDGKVHKAPRTEPPAKRTTIYYEPKQTRDLLLCILNLCLEVRDIPHSEKMGIMTALPKSEGLVTSMNDIRPITVGPAISRLLHEILAHRLGSLISGSGNTKKSIIDPAQFAFMAGYDIHEPNNSA